MRGRFVVMSSRQRNAILYAQKTDWSVASVFSDAGATPVVRSVVSKLNNVHDGEIPPVEKRRALAAI